MCSEADIDTDCCRPTSFASVTPHVCLQELERGLSSQTRTLRTERLRADFDVFAAGFPGFRHEPARPCRIVPQRRPLLCRVCRRREMGEAGAWAGRVHRQCRQGAPGCGDKHHPRHGARVPRGHARQTRRGLPHGQRRDTRRARRRGAIQDARHAVMGGGLHRYVAGREALGEQDVDAGWALGLAPERPVGTKLWCGTLWPDFHQC